MKRHALFVGVDTYADGHIPNLSCAVSDATDLHGFFKYGAGYDRVELLPNPAGKKEVLGMVQELTSDLNSGDFFLFFFAGHGFRVGENHVLVCAKDLYEDVKYEDDGLPLGQLKRRLSGAFDSALLLDACQSDILATRGGEGIAERDLSLIHEAPPVRVGGGTLTIVTSCDAGQTAAELSERRHGLFTVAMLDLLKEAQKARVRLDLSDVFRMSLGRRMGEIAARSGISTEQRPRFSCTGDACFVLLDGVVQMALASQPSPSYHQPAAAPTLVSCPVCGKKNRPEDTFKCRECGRDNLCHRHYDEVENCCADCALKRKAAREEVQRKRRAQNNEHYGRTSIGVTDKFSVVLKDFGVNKPSVLKELQKFYRVSSFEIKRSFKSVPAIVMRSVSKDDAERCRFQLENVGADVAIGHDGFFDEMLHGTKTRRLFDNETIYIITVSAVLLGGTYVLAKLLVWWLFT